MPNISSLFFMSFYDAISPKQKRTSSSHYTPHLNGKKLSTNSPWDFEYVLETMDDYWVGPDENFFSESTPTRWHCNHFSKKWSKSKSDTTLSIKKPFVTPNFCGQNFSAKHRFWVWIFLSPRITEYLVWKTENIPKWGLSKNDRKSSLGSFIN